MVEAKPGEAPPSLCRPRRRRRQTLARFSIMPSVVYITKSSKLEHFQPPKRWQSLAQPGSAHQVGAACSAK